MLKGLVKTGQTTEGKYFAQVRKFNGETLDTYYETAEYVTERMAVADAECWKAFHMTETPEEQTPEASETENDYSICEDDKVYSRSGKAVSGREFAERLKKIEARAAASGSKIQYAVRPFTQSKRKGFHLDIKVGSTPVRRFTIHKDEGQLRDVREYIIVNGVEYGVKVDTATTYQDPNTHTVTLVRTSDGVCTWFSYPKDETDYRNARFYNVARKDEGIAHPRNFEEACKLAIEWRLA